MMLPGLGITWEWTRWLLRNLGHGISSRSISGLVHIFSTHPRLTPWAVFFAASRPSDQEDSRAIFAERIEFRPGCCRYEMSVLRFETGVEAPSCFRDAPWALGAWRFEYRSRAYHNATWEFLKFGDSGFAPQPSSLATTTGAELCSACRGLRAAPTH